MTTGRFNSVPLSEIIVKRDDRQRRELTGIEELAASIAENGLINPIVVNETAEGLVLVAGERRLTAHQFLGLDSIMVQFASDLDPIQLHILELEENVQREDLTWQDHVRAVADYHKLRSKTEESWSASATAQALRMSNSGVQRHLTVSRALEEQVPEVMEAPQLSTAFNFAQRREERRKTAAKRDLLAELNAPAPQSGEPVDAQSGGEEAPAQTSPLAARNADIISGDFISWSTGVLDEPFNFLHVDFPYGVSAGDTRGQSAAKSLGGYADSKDVYDNLCNAFVSNIDRFCAPSAHLMFWFSMDYYAETLDLLRTAGWRVDPFPLVWFKSDNTGILPDANRGPRRVYETAFFCARGDRKIVRATGNAVGAASPPKAEKIHMSQKARPMLEHFFRMIVDETTRMLDPTCGSGEAIGVAQALGAEYALGIELNEEYAAEARVKQGLE